MSAPEAAALTSALLVRKGAAVPAGYATLAATLRGVRAPGPGHTEGSVPAHGAEAGIQTAPRSRPRDLRTRFSLRLDEERHLKLKLTAAHLQMKLQDVVIAALDGYLDQVGPAVMRGQCLCLEGRCAARGPESERR